MKSNFLNVRMDTSDKRAMQARAKALGMTLTQYVSYSSTLEREFGIHLQELQHQRRTQISDPASTTNLPQALAQMKSDLTKELKAFIAQQNKTDIGTLTSIADKEDPKPARLYRVLEYHP